MIDFWATLGLAIVDEPFRKQVVNALKKKDYLRELTNVVNKEHNFHMSRFEVKELADLMANQKVLDSMEEIHGFWRPKICEVSLTPDPGYVHVKPSLAAVSAMRKLLPTLESTGPLDPEGEALRDFIQSFESGNGNAEYPSGDETVHTGPGAPIS